MREIEFSPGFIDTADASCLVRFGRTKVLCTASIEKSVPPFLRDSGSGWITAEYAMLPGSTSGGRKRREIRKRDGRSVEIQRLIGRSLRAAIDLDALGEVSIVVDCDVLQADGGTRTAAISGGWVALIMALQKLAGENGTDPIQYRQGQVAAVSVGIVNQQIHCDLDYELDSNADVDMNVVMRDEALIEVQGTGEQDSFSREQLNTLLDSAEEGISRIYEAQLNALQQAGIE
ncbi:ribonuclease PH [Salinispira pacifica]|uniref:Ribonuclease PH n=1 Tax=Salinispira pacifica TaxID=1307761 RepID=V5WIT9_9SPIO|nr:ribonuclease PH [Salinispira pacifica]AHC15713.1 Ribonuclease PH [Salinispira pacifica]